MLYHEKRNDVWHEEEGHMEDREPELEPAILERQDDFMDEYGELDEEEED